VIRTRPPHRVIAAVLAAIAATAALISGCGSGVATALHSRLLSASDLPAGWSEVSTSPASVHTDAPCLSGLPAKPKGWSYATAAFVEGTSVPSLGELLATGLQAHHAWQNLDRAMARCRTATITIAGKKAPVSIQPLPLPRVAGTSSAYAWSFTFGGVRIGVDLVLFQAGKYTGYLTYSDLGPPAAATVTAFVGAAVTKAKTGSTTPVPGAVSIASAPIQTAHTKLGAVAYRTVGSGAPLLLITGYSGTMEGWDRRFADTLAQHHRVVIFDNAGVGHTQALPAPLTIDAMANQTSALITALGLNHPDVLGWSMGSMIAQALAVLHSSQVHRLILCASYPGNATTVRPAQAAIHALTSTSQQTVLNDIFPASQTAAQHTYLAAISSYPSAPAAPVGTVSAQGHAVDVWWAGRDPAGQQAATITAPTLIADGTADRLDPLANSHALARLIPRAKLILYPDAGHAFLFQDQTTFISLIESFLH
jgi:pimeloyl-ACP methyl ester carboxylesterase